MGKLLAIKRHGDNFQVEMSFKESEVKHLGGSLDNIQIFSEDSFAHRTHISQRGKNAATKYFLIPRQLRKGLQLSWDIACHKIEIGDRVFFVYAMPKTLE